jgi:hypothetical protein
LLVDSSALVSGVLVHEASIADRDGARLLLGKAAEKLPRMEKVWADRGYNGKIGEWIKEKLGWTLEIVKPPRRQVGKGAAGGGATTVPERVHRAAQKVGNRKDLRRLDLA